MSAEMRGANWDEIFQRRSDEGATGASSGRLRSCRGGLADVRDHCDRVHERRVFDRQRGWVRDMPSLYPIGFSALAIGYGLARVRRNELLLHPLALLTGATLVLLR